MAYIYGLLSLSIFFFLSAELKDLLKPSFSWTNLGMSERSYFLDSLEDCLPIFLCSEESSPRPLPCPFPVPLRLGMTGILKISYSLLRMTLSLPRTVWFGLICDFWRGLVAFLNSILRTLILKSISLYTPFCCQVCLLNLHKCCCLMYTCHSFKVPTNGRTKAEIDPGPSTVSMECTDISELS